MSLVDPELAGRAIERALRRGGDLAEVYVEERHGFAVTLDDGRVERPQTGSERGASIRMVAGEASYFGYVDGLEEPDLMRVADSVAQAAAGGDGQPAALRSIGRARSSRSARRNCSGSPTKPRAAPGARSRR